MRFGDLSDYDLWVIGLLWPSLRTMVSETYGLSGAIRAAVLLGLEP